MNITYQGQDYTSVRLGVLDHLCCDILLGIYFQAQHSSVVLNSVVTNTTLTVCGFTTLRTKSPALFKNLTPDCHPVAVRSRKYSQEDRVFVNKEVRRLLKEGQSPWRAQVVVVKGENHKQRMAMDYSQTINRFTLLDAFPLPHVNDLVNQIDQFRVFSTVDSKSAMLWSTPKYLCEKRINLTLHLRQVRDYTNLPACHLVPLMALPVSSV